MTVNYKTILNAEVNKIYIGVEVVGGSEGGFRNGSFFRLFDDVEGPSSF
jgi:hypothetical protein